MVLRLAIGMGTAVFVLFFAWVFFLAGAALATWVHPVAPFLLAALALPLLFWRALIHPITLLWTVAFLVVPAGLMLSRLAVA